jgi:hypothetical protein
MSEEQALPVLLQAVDALVQKLATVLSGAYVNSLLIQMDALLKRSRLQPAFQASLRAVPVSAQGLFGSCAKAAVEESTKRTTDQAFAAIARQGKRPQFFQNQPAKRSRWSGSVADRKGSQQVKPQGRPFRQFSGRGRGGRRSNVGAPVKRQSKGVSPQ